MKVSTRCPCGNSHAGIAPPSQVRPWPVSSQEIQSRARDSPLRSFRGKKLVRESVHWNTHAALPPFCYSPPPCSGTLRASDDRLTYCHAGSRGRHLLHRRHLERTHRCSNPSATDPPWRAAGLLAVVGLDAEQVSHRVLVFDLIETTHQLMSARAFTVWT